MDKKPSQNTVIDHINKANKAKVFYKVTGSRNNIKISNAPQYWQKHPETIYLAGIHLAGSYQDLFQTITDLGYDANTVQNTIQAQGITAQNYQTDKAQLFNNAVAEQKAVPSDKAKTSAAKRAEDQIILNKIDSFTMHVKNVRASGNKLKGGAVKVAGGTTTTTGGRGQRAVAISLADRVAEAVAKGKVVNVSNISQPGMLMDGNMVLKKNFKIVDAPGPKSRKLRWVQGLNIASDNPVAYKQAATILGRPDFATRYEQAYGVQAVMSPALTATMGQAPTGLGFAPGMMSQQTFPQPAFSPMTQPTMMPQPNMMTQPLPQPSLSPRSQPTLPQPLPQPSLSPRSQPTLPQPLPQPSLSPRSQPTLPQPSLSPRTSPLPAPGQLPAPSRSPTRVVGGLPPVQGSPTGSPTRVVGGLPPVQGSPTVRLSPRSAGAQMRVLGSPRSEGF